MADNELADNLKAAVTASKLSLYAIAKNSGVEYKSLHRFMAGTSGITLDNTAKLCKLFGMRFTKPQRHVKGFVQS